MRFPARDTLALLREQRRVDKQTEDDIDRVLSPIARKRGALIADALAKDFNRRDHVLQAMRFYEREIKDAFFSLSDKTETALRDVFLRRGIEFESGEHGRFQRFWESSIAEGVNRFSEWMAWNLTQGETRGLEFRDRSKGYFYLNNEKVYYRRRSNGEARRKAAEAKMRAIQYNAEKAISEEIEKAAAEAVKERKEYIEEAEKYIKPQTKRIAFPIIGKTQKQIENTANRYLVISEDREIFDLFALDTLLKEALK